MYLQKYCSGVKKVQYGIIILKVSKLFVVLEHVLHASTFSFYIIRFKVIEDLVVLRLHF